MQATIFLFGVVLFSSLTASTATYSALFGPNGVPWNKTRLPDWSTAGRRAGIPSYPNPSSYPNVVTKYGAAADGSRDSTTSFRAAIDAGGPFYIPPGTYKFSSQISLKSGTVMLGAGIDKTTLIFQKSLNDLYHDGGEPNGQTYGKYHAYGGLISVASRGAKDTHEGFPTGTIGHVNGRVASGSKSFTISLASGGRMPSVGDVIIVSQSSNTNELLMYLYEGDTQHLQMAAKDIPLVHANFAAVVTGVSGNTVNVGKPIPFDLNVTPGISTSVSSGVWPMMNVGIQDLTIDTERVHPYSGNEPGWNLIQFNYAAESWVTRVRLNKFDSAVLLRGAYHITLKDITMSCQGTSCGGFSSHFGVLASDDSFSNLIDGVTLTTNTHHGLSLYNTHLNAFINCKTTTIDSRGRAPSRNLFSNVAWSTDAYGQSGNRLGDGSRAAAWSTYWNLSPHPGNWAASYGTARKTIVGGKGGTNTGGKLWYESFSDAVQPPELYAAQKAIGGS